jgi:hypothetical protein
MGKKNWDHKITPNFTKERNPVATARGSDLIAKIRGKFK